MAIKEEAIKQVLSLVKSWVKGSEKPDTSKITKDSPVLGWKVTKENGNECIGLKAYLPFQNILFLHSLPANLVYSMPNKMAWLNLAFGGEEGVWLKNHVPFLDENFQPEFSHVNLLLDLLGEDNTAGYGRGYYGFGEAGVGKTSTAAWLAAVLNQPVVQMNCKPNMEVEEMFISHTCHNGVWDQSEGPILQAIHHNIPLVIDELDLAPQEFVPALNNLIEGRKFSVPFLEESVVQAGSCFKIIGFGNTGAYGSEVGSYNGRSSLDASTLDRMYKDYYQPLTVEKFESVIRKNFTVEQIDESLKTKLANFAIQMNKNARDGAFPELISPRGLISLCRQAVQNTCVVKQPILYAIGTVYGSVLESSDYLEKMLAVYSGFLSESSASTNALQKLWDDRALPCSRVTSIPADQDSKKKAA